MSTKSTPMTTPSTRTESSSMRLMPCYKNRLLTDSLAGITQVSGDGIKRNNRKKKLLPMSS